MMKLFKDDTRNTSCLGSSSAKSACVFQTQAFLFPQLGLMSIQGVMWWLAHTLRVFSRRMRILADFPSSFFMILTSPVPRSFHSGGSHSTAYLKVFNDDSLDFIGHNTTQSPSVRPTCRAWPAS